MLILRRKIGERIVIDGRIEVTVLHIRGGKVRLGFNAPHDVRVLREEIFRGASPLEVTVGSATAVEIEAAAS
jgi:carbon storage regulator